jgi:hypothetical protein
VGLAWECSAGHLAQKKVKKSLKRAAGLWVDHRKAVIVVVTDKGEETKLIISQAGLRQGII